MLPEPRLELPSLWTVLGCRTIQFQSSRLIHQTDANEEQTGVRFSSVSRIEAPNKFWSCKCRSAGEQLAQRLTLENLNRIPILTDSIGQISPWP